MEFTGENIWSSKWILYEFLEPEQTITAPYSTEQLACLNVTDMNFLWPGSQAIFLLNDIAFTPIANTMPQNKWCSASIFSRSIIFRLSFLSLHTTFLIWAVVPTISKYPKITEKINWILTTTHLTPGGSLWPVGPEAHPHMLVYVARLTPLVAC